MYFCEDVKRWKTNVKLSYYPFHLVSEINGSILNLLFHVDDILASNTRGLPIFHHFFTAFSAAFPIKYLGTPAKYLSYDITRNRDTRVIILHQTEFTKSLILAAGMADDHPSKSKGDLFKTPLPTTSVLEDVDFNFPYRELVGGLQHLACHSRPDIQYEASTLARYSHDFGSIHVQACRQLLRYLLYTRHYGLHLSGDSDLITLTGWADAGTLLDPAGRGVGGFVFQLGTSTVSYKTKWFKTVHPSTTELEYVSLFHASSKAIRLRKILKGFGYSMSEATVIHEDNEGCIKYAHSNDLSGRMQHLNVKFHFIRQAIDDGLVRLAKIPTTSNLADVLTKSTRG